MFRSSNCISSLTYLYIVKEMLLHKHENDEAVVEDSRLNIGGKPLIHSLVQKLLSNAAQLAQKRN